MVRKATYLVIRQDDCHSHACIVPECGMFCPPEVVTSNAGKTTIRFRHFCRVAQKQIHGQSVHMCRKCHHTAAQCTAAVCTYITCSRPQKFCMIPAPSRPAAHAAGSHPWATSSPSVETRVLSTSSAALSHSARDLIMTVSSHRLCFKLHQLISSTPRRI